MSSDRARLEFRWEPQVSSLEALLELVAGIREGAAGSTPPLDPDAGGPARTGELLSGIGAREHAS